MFAARNVGWLNHRTNVDEPSNSCLCADSDAVSDWFFLLQLALLAAVAAKLNVLS